MPTRRHFLMGCSAAIAALSGAHIQDLAFAAPDDGGSEEDVLVVLFLRGAWDALSVVPPIGGADRGYYEAARPYLRIATHGKHGAIPLDAQFGFHPALAPLHDLYRGGHLAVVHAVGMNDDTRSHFDAMQFMEAGTPGQRTTVTGWITRHMQSVPHRSRPLAAIGTGGGLPASLQGEPDAVAITSPQSFSLPGDATTARLLHRLYTGNTDLDQVGQQTLRSVDAVQRLGLKTYVPAHGVTYPPNSDFSVALQTIAQVLKARLNLRVATVDLGGWDTHEYQGDDGQGYLADLLGLLAQGLYAFYEDLERAHLMRRVTVVTMSEFGRRLNQNASGGTDHGHGSVMFVMGGGVNGGHVYGRWPGLRSDQLYDQADLAVTTDYRQVLGEILGTRLRNTHLDVVFPGYSMGSPLGMVRPR